MTDNRFKKKRLAFYCDFDGTIAKQDMIGVTVKNFAPPEALDIVADVNARRLTVQDGVEAVFRRIPSRELPRIVEFTRERVEVRDGFPEFVEMCRRQDWRLTVVSGGFDFFVEPIVEPYRDVITMYCNKLDASGEFLKVEWKQPCDYQCEGGCGLCKPAVIRATVHPYETVIVIGDGVTDVKAAKQADFVFARDRLLSECERLGLPFAAFETFYDICKDIL